MRQAKYFSTFFIALSLLSVNLAANAAEQIDQTMPAVQQQTQPQQSGDIQQKIKRLQQILSQVQQPTGQNAVNQPGQQGTAPNNSASIPQDQTAPLQPSEVTTTETKPDLYEEAFNGVVNQLMPMSPEQISNLKSNFNEAQRAAAAPVGVPPKPTASSVIVNLAPNATPPVVRLQAGYISSLVFVDSTGQPWPIAAYSLGDPTAFNIQWDKKGNTLLVQSLTFYKRSNIAVILKDLNTPVMLSLLPGQEAVDYRVDLRVPGLGPNAAFSQNGLPESSNPILVNVLNGVPPPNSTSVGVMGGDCQAWLVQDKLFLRTNLDIISPAFKSKITSIDGMHAFEIQKTPRILALQRGKIITLKLEGI